MKCLERDLVREMGWEGLREVVTGEHDGVITKGGKPPAVALL